MILIDQQNLERREFHRTNDLVTLINAFLKENNRGKQNIQGKIFQSLSRWRSSNEYACQCRKCKRCRFHSWVRKIPQSRKWQPTPVFLSGKVHEQRGLAGCSLWSCKGLDITEQRTEQPNEMCAPYLVPNLRKSTVTPPPTKYIYWTIGEIFIFPRYLIY